jgi:transaldolase / glucose-6-phosphate isomerase
VAELERSGISMKQVTDRLLGEGVTLFAEAFGTLLDAVRRRRRVSDGARQATHLDAVMLQAAVDGAMT